MAHEFPNPSNVPGHTGPTSNSHSQVTRRQLTLREIDRDVARDAVTYRKRAIRRTFQLTVVAGLLFAGAIVLAALLDYNGWVKTASVVATAITWGMTIEWIGGVMWSLGGQDSLSGYDRLGRDVKTARLAQADYDELVERHDAYRTHEAERIVREATGG